MGGQLGGRGTSGALTVEGVRRNAGARGGYAFAGNALLHLQSGSVFAIDDGKLIAASIWFSQPLHLSFVTPPHALLGSRSPFHSAGG